MTGVGIPSRPSMNVGTILEVGDGIARADGLSDAMASEVVEVIDSKGKVKAQGLVMNLEIMEVGLVLLDQETPVNEGDTVKTTGTILSVPAGNGIIGRVVDALARPIDGKGAIKKEKDMPIECIAPGVITRQSVTTPLQTGIRAIDTMIPIGRGQRELIIGDRGTGKTTIAIDTIMNQKPGDVVCIYTAIGQRTNKLAQLVQVLEERNSLDHTIIVAATADDPVSMQFLAPYAATAIGEYFMGLGKDVLLVYDDLSKHAWSYRQLSLLLRRPSGREAYPGDVFYLHSRLLERAAKIANNFGGGSMTALPIIETQASDVSAYIPTNVISITDGQIYLNPDLFYAGMRPAIDVGLSVSRVGGNAQIPAMKKVAGSLRLSLAQYRALEAFAQFAQDLEKETKEQLDRGKRVTEILKQKQHEPSPVEEQVAVIWAVTQGYLDTVPVEKVLLTADAFLNALKTNKDKPLAALAKEKTLTDDIVAAFTSNIKLTVEENQP